MSVELTRCWKCAAEVTVYAIDETGLCNTCRWVEGKPAAARE